MATLYELTQTARELYALAEEIDEQVITDTLESIGVGDKLEDYCKVIRQLEADAEMFKVEKLRLAERQKSIERNIERMKKAIHNYMTAVEHSEEEAGLFKIKIRKSESLVVDDWQKLGENFLQYQEPKVDAMAVKRAIKAGEEIKGVHIEINESINIK